MTEHVCVLPCEWSGRHEEGHRPEYQGFVMWTHAVLQQDTKAGSNGACPPRCSGPTRQRSHNASAEGLSAHLQLILQLRDDVCDRLNRLLKGPPRWVFRLVPLRPLSNGSQSMRFTSREAIGGFQK